MPCSYCHIAGHTIRRCNSHQIEEHYDTIQTFYENTCRDNNISGKRLFINYVNLNFDTITVKAIGLKYMGGILPGAFTQRNFRKNYIIEKLWEHFNGVLGYGLPRVPDEVPIYAQDLVTWTIDRTPDARPNARPDAIPLYHIASWIRRNNDAIREYLSVEEMSFREDEFIPFQTTTGIQPTNLLRRFDETERKYDIHIQLEKDLIKEDKEDDCGICYELTKDSDKVQLNCGHTFCGQCIKGCLNANKTLCAMCRCPIKKISVKNQQVYELVSEYCVL